MASESAAAVKRWIRNYRLGSFDRHASLEAIDAAIRDADEAQGELGRHIAWLQDIKRRRKLEIERGEWPGGAAMDGALRKPASDWAGGREPQ